MIDFSAIRERFAALSRHRANAIAVYGRRARLGAPAAYGGIAAVSAATGIASTIGRGLKELASADTLDVGRVRRRGGGRKPLVKKDATFPADSLALVDPSERGDPMSPLRWTCKSLSQLAAGSWRRKATGSAARWSASCCTSRSSRPIARPWGRRQPSRSRCAVRSHQRHRGCGAGCGRTGGSPVDTKKKELVGDFKNAGREWRPADQPQDVRVHDFLIKELGRAVPYGV